MQLERGDGYRLADREGTWLEGLHGLVGGGVDGHRAASRVKVSEKRMWKWGKVVAPGASSPVSTVRVLLFESADSTMVGILSADMAEKVSLEQSWTLWYGGRGTECG